MMRSDRFAALLVAFAFFQNSIPSVAGERKARQVPPGLNADLLATQLTRQLATGELFPVSGNNDEWIIIARSAHIELQSLSDFKLQPEYYERSPLLIALISWQQVPSSPAERGGTVTVRAMTKSLIEGTAAQVIDRALDGTPQRQAADLVPCVDPEGAREPNSAGGYPDIDGQFRWLKLSSSHRVLVAKVSRQEGYAGGGGTFTGEIMLEQRGTALVPVACYATSRSQLFAGAWNNGGTREHAESNAKWTIRVMPGGEWPRLRVKAAEADAPGASIEWDPAVGHYVEAK